MSIRAQILAATSDRAAVEVIAEKLGRHSYGVSHASTSEDALYLARAVRPDIVIAMDPLDEMGAIALGARLGQNSQTADLPRVLMVKELDSETAVAALRAGFQDVIQQDVAEDVLIARLHPLRRASTMHAELRQRAGIAWVMGVTVPGQLSIDRAATVSLMFQEATPSLATHFAGNGFKAESSTDPYLAEARLEDEFFDAAIFKVGADVAPVLHACRRIRNNPRLHNLPLILLADAGQIDEPGGGYNSGASVVLPSSTTPEVLRPIVLAFARRHLEWQALDEALSATRAGPTRDTVTGAYSKAFFNAYLDARVSIAHSGGRPLTMLLLRFSSIASVEAEFGIDAAIALQERLSSWIDSLLRIEDLQAYLGESEYCIMLPDTTGAEAGTVLSRLAGVLTQTDFAIPDVYRPIRTSVEVALVALQRGEVGEKMLQRARGALG